MGRLRRVDCSTPGITRRRRGRGFEYVDAAGQAIDSDDVLARIRELAIPPAWKEVWICPHPRGHLQATGMDAAGRKQYLYHPDWRRRRDQQKFDDMLDFARALPRLRRRVSRDLSKADLSRDQVLACAVRLLDRGFFRIGSEGYAEENETYGLATMLRAHVALNGKAITFDYPAKGGQRRMQSIVDEDVKSVVEQLKRRRGGGPELLAYRNGRRWLDLGSDDINAYIKAAVGGEFSAKDFRTWHATVLAAAALAAEANGGKSASGRKRTITSTVKGVAHYLGNTPAVCRSSYIDPRVFDRFLSGWTIGGVLPADTESWNVASPRFRRRVEEAVIDLITEDHLEESSAIEKVA